MGAVALAGLFEGRVEHARFLSAVCAAGAAALYTAPVCFLLSVAARALWRGWRPLFASEPGADGALFLGGAVYALLAVCTLGAVGFATSWIALAGGGGSEPLSPALVATVLVAATALLLAASRPAALALSRAVRALGLRHPLACLWAAVALAGILALGVWSAVVGPALAKVDYGYSPYVSTALMALVLFHWALRRLPPRSARSAARAAALLCLALAAGTVAMQARDPATLFDAWYSMPIGGLAIGATYDVDSLRALSLRADPAPRPRPGAEHPDVVILTIDTVRADQVGAYGGPADMPNLARVAARGALFEWAFAPGNNTRQSLSSMMTGVSPARVRGRVVAFGLKLDPRHIVLPERFRAAGYTTAGFLCCPNHLGGARKIGLDRGLQSVEYQADGGALAQRASQWLDRTARDRSPRYVWVHFFEPHDWQRMSATGGDDTDDEGGDGRASADARSRYRRALETADRNLAAILRAVEAGGRPTILVITSDHGEGLGEHHALHHASNLYSSQIRVPLVVAGPGLGPPRRVSEAVGLVDLAPTLLDLAGFEPPGAPEMDGRSIADLLRPGASPAPGGGEAYSVMVQDRSVSHTGRALVAGRLKLIAIDHKKPELYDLIADPGETRNLASSRPKLVKQLTGRLARLRAADAVSPF
jgi:hypothetical protein